MLNVHDKNYRLVPIEAAQKLKNGPLYTYLVLLFKSDFYTHRSEVNEETLATITGFAQKTIGNHLAKMEEAGLIQIIRTRPSKCRKKNYYRIVHPKKNFIICDSELIEMTIGNMTLKEESELKGFLLMVKCLCVNNCNITYYSYERMAQHLGIGLTTIKKHMPRLISHQLVEGLTRQTGYRILVTCFDKGNTYPFPEGTPEVCRTIYNDIRQWCHEQEMMCPPYLHECISAIATHYPCTRDELKANMHDEAFMNRYSVLTVLRSRIPNPPQKVESLQYFVKVLLSKTADLTPEEEKSFIL